MARIRSLAILVALLLALLSSPEVSVSAPIKAGQSCAKKGQIKSYQNKKFQTLSYKCTLKNGKLRWAIKSNSSLAPVASPSPTSSPTPTPTQTATAELPNIGLNLLNSTSSHPFSAEVGQVISDSIRISTEVKITEIVGYISNTAGIEMVTGVVTLDGYVEKISNWKIQYSTGDRLVAGSYTKNLAAKTVDGRKLLFLTSPLEIKSKSLPGALRKSIATCSETKGDCPKIADPISLAPVSSCKISDHSDYGISQGFPRSSLANVGDRSIKVLWMPVGFTDIPLTEEFATKSEKYFAEYKNYFLEQSYGRAKLELVIPDSSLWLRISQSASSFSDANSGDLNKMVQSLLDRITSPDLSKYDAIYLITPESQSFQSGGMSYPTYQTSRFGQVKGVYLVIGGGLEHIPHSMGHNLFYLEDLYIHDYFMKPGRDKWPMQHEIMGGGGPFSGWQRWLNGWIDDSDIRCVTLRSETSIHALKTLESKSGTRLLVIPTSTKSAWIAEVRNDDGPEGNGLFIYSLDTNFDNGNGPMANVRGTLRVGGSWSGQGIKISVIAESEERLFLTLTKG